MKTKCCAHQEESWIWSELTADLPIPGCWVPKVETPLALPWYALGAPTANGTVWGGPPEVAHLWGDRWPCPGCWSCHQHLIFTARLPQAHVRLQNGAFTDGRVVVGWQTGWEGGLRGVVTGGNVGTHYSSDGYHLLASAPLNQPVGSIPLIPFPAARSTIHSEEGFVPGLQAKCPFFSVLCIEAPLNQWAIPTQLSYCYCVWQYLKSTPCSSWVKASLLHILRNWPAGTCQVQPQ